MSKKNHKNRTQGKAVTKETVIIAALISFILGYAVHGLVYSYRNFGQSPPAGTASAGAQNFNNPAPQNAPRTADDDALLAAFAVIWIARIIGGHSAYLIALTPVVFVEGMLNSIILMPEPASLIILLGLVQPPRFARRRCPT